MNFQNFTLKFINKWKFLHWQINKNPKNISKISLSRRALLWKNDCRNNGHALIWYWKGEVILAHLIISSDRATMRLIFIILSILDEVTNNAWIYFMFKIKKLDTMIGRTKGEFFFHSNDVSVRAQKRNRERKITHNKNFFFVAYYKTANGKLLLNHRRVQWIGCLLMILKT